MADNYLEKRYEEVFGGKKTVKKVGCSLDSLLLKNRSCRGYNHSVVVKEDVLRKIVSVNTKIPSARNQQALRFRIVTAEEEVAAVNQNIKLGGALPELHLPLPGTEPLTFIIVCSAIEPERYVYIDLGISLQSMLLKAVEIGLNGIIICAFNAKAIAEALHLDQTPLAVLAIGKSAEKFRLVDMPADGSVKYYRDEEGVHCIPKRKLEDILI
ncbi:MAG: nitroreductase family protein [Bacteroidales bacterium]|nr:nitroreductase family protein [Bacteroidales bacterium]